MTRRWRSTALPGKSPRSSSIDRSSIDRSLQASVDPGVVPRTCIQRRKVYNFALKMMNFAFKMMNFVFKLMNFGRGQAPQVAHADLSRFYGCADMEVPHSVLSNQVIYIKNDDFYKRNDDFCTKNDGLYRGGRLQPRIALC